jgi:hypothetical protein
MKTKISILILCCAALSAQATTITFSGIVRTADVSGAGDVAAQVGDKVYGFLAFDPGTLVVSEAGISLPEGLTGEITTYLQILTAFPGGFSFASDTFGGLGQDGELDFTVLLNGSGTFYIVGINLDPDSDSGFSFRQIYSGNITSVTATTPDTGSTALLMLMALVCLGLARMERRTR